MTVLLRHRDRLTHECVEAVSGWELEKCRVDYQGITMPICRRNHSDSREAPNDPGYEDLVPKLQ